MDRAQGRALRRAGGAVAHQELTASGRVGAIILVALTVVVWFARKLDGHPGHAEAAPRVASVD